MSISSQTLKEILQITEAFKSQLYDTLCGTLHDRLHDVAYGLKDSFHSIQDSLDSMQERFLMADIMNEYHQEVYFWYSLEDNCDDWYMDSCHF